MTKLLISRTYEVVTPESAERGETAEAGFNAEREAVTFRELVDVLREHPVPSSWPVREVGPWDWASSHEWQDYRTGAVETEGVHWHRDNPPRLLKYWGRAWKLAGVGRR